MQGIARTHTVAQVQVLNQIRREVHHLIVGVAYKGQGANATLNIAGVGINQVGASQLILWVIDSQAVIIQNALRQLIIRPRLKPTLPWVMNKLAVSDVFAEKLIVVEKVAVQPLNELAQCRTQGAFFRRALTIGETHGRGCIAHVQRPHMRHNVAPRRDFNLHAQIRQDGGHVGDGLLQWQVFTLNIGFGACLWLGHQQGLGIAVEAIDNFNLEIGAGLHHFFDRTAVD